MTDHTPDSYSLHTTLDAIRWATAQLESAMIESPRLNSELILGHLINLTRLDLYLKFDRPLSPEESAMFRGLVEQRIAGKPVQYITETTEFYSLPLSISPAVLIPRPETELLVEQAIASIEPWIQEDAMDLFRRDSSRIAMDIGTGSGAIAVALAVTLPQLKIYATDISPDALEVARTNARRHGVHERIVFLCGSLFEPVRTLNLTNSIDIILSNPPYIPRHDIPQLPREIREYEPHLALDGGEDGLDIYRLLIEGAPQYLRPGGKLMLEIGADQGAGVSQLISASGQFDAISVIPDYNRHDRVIAARRSAAVAPLSRRRR